MENIEVVNVRDVGEKDLVGEVKVVQDFTDKEGRVFPSFYWRVLDGGKKVDFALGFETAVERAKTYAEKKGKDRIFYERASKKSRKDEEVKGKGDIYVTG